MQQLRITITLLALVAFGMAVPASAQETSASSGVPEYDPSVCYEFNDGGELSEECLAMIEAYPVPPVENIDQDRYTLSTYSFWRVGPDPIPTFDAANGGQIGEIAQGFNFVRAIDLSVEGWIQIEGGAWIRESDATYSQPSYLTGVTFDDGLEYPFAVVLDLSRIFVSAYPGGPRSQENGRWIKRYEYVPIFATATDADGWMWYMIGANQWVEQRFLAVFEKIERPEDASERWVAVDLYEQTLIAYEGDTPVYATLVSTGLPTHETNQGEFNVWASLPRDGMSGAAGAPSAYALQSVPWVMYFDGGISLHGTYWHDLFGYRQSHGCVNLSVSDARWVFYWLHEDDLQNEVTNTVYVYSSGTYGVTATGI